MNNYEVGMLCLIIGTNFEETSSNIGKCVELVEYLPVGTEFSKTLGGRVSIKEDCWIVKGDNLAQKKSSGNVVEYLEYAGAAQRHLIPLKGDEMQNEIFEDELLEEFV